MLFLHGILGNRANLRTMARRFVERRPDWSALLVDVREHGDSVGLDGPATLAVCAEDLLTLDAIAPQPILGAVGHSFGGKLALAWTLLRPRWDELWVLDSTPSARDDAATTAEPVLLALESIAREHPEGFAKREGFIEAVRARGLGPGIAEWLAMSLRVVDGRRKVGVSLPRIRELLASYERSDLWPAVEGARPDQELHLVIADRSSVWTPEDRAHATEVAARKPEVHVHVVPDAGHWLHVDAPDAVDALLASGRT